jgi:hypothetical protein
MDGAVSWTFGYNLCFLHHWSVTLEAPFDILRLTKHPLGVFRSIRTAGQRLSGEK